jgi:hypothetical protein
MIELLGSGSLDNIMVLIVEGDGAGAGTLDRAYNLTGNSIGGSGYFVLGTTDGGATVDFSIGANNAIENGTETFYLLDAASPAAVTALVATDLDADNDGTYDATTIASLGTILDIVAMTDGNVGDLVYDSAPTRGPDGSGFFPAGIFRTGNYPGDWCNAAFLDFDDVANLNVPRTPGAANPGHCGLSEAVPTTSSWSLILMTLAMLGVTAVVARRIKNVA